MRHRVMDTPGGGATGCAACHCPLLAASTEKGWCGLSRDLKMLEKYHGSIHGTIHGNINWNMLKRKLEGTTRKSKGFYRDFMESWEYHGIS